MRKYIRNIMRASAKQENAKPSRWLRAVFHQYQLKKYGEKKRSGNQAIGSHPRRLWRSRIAQYGNA